MYLGVHNKIQDESSVTMQDCFFDDRNKLLNQLEPTWSATNKYCLTSNPFGFLAASDYMIFGQNIADKMRGERGGQKFLLHP